MGILGNPVMLGGTSNNIKNYWMWEVYIAGDLAYGSNVVDRPIAGSVQGWQTAEVLNIYYANNIIKNPDGTIELENPNSYSFSESTTSAEVTWANENLKGKFISNYYNGGNNIIKIPQQNDVAFSRASYLGFYYYLIVSDSQVVSGTKTFNEILVDEESDKYPVNKIVSNNYYIRRGQLGDYPKIENYTGTGTFGQDNANYLSFNCPLKQLIISNIATITCGDNNRSITIYPIYTNIKWNVYTYNKSLMVEEGVYQNRRIHSITFKYGGNIYTYYASKKVIYDSSNNRIQLDTTDESYTTFKGKDLSSYKDYYISTSSTGIAYYLPTEATITKTGTNNSDNVYSDMLLMITPSNAPVFTISWYALSTDSSTSVTAESQANTASTNYSYIDF